MIDDENAFMSCLNVAVTRTSSGIAKHIYRLFYSLKILPVHAVHPRKLLIVEINTGSSKFFGKGWRVLLPKTKHRIPQRLVL